LLLLQPPKTMQIQFTEVLSSKHLTAKEIISHPYRFCYIKTWTIDIYILFGTMDMRPDCQDSQSSYHITVTCATHIYPIFPKSAHKCVCATIFIPLKTLQTFTRITVRIRWVHPAIWTLSTIVKFGACVWSWHKSTAQIIWSLFRVKTALVWGYWSRRYRKIDKLLVTTVGMLNG